MADRDILPDNVRPTHYTLHIHDLNFDDWSYSGRVVIDVDITRPSKEVVLNALEVKLHEASVEVATNKSSQQFDAATLDVDEKKQRGAIVFAQELPTGKAKLTIRYTGYLNNDLAGFYRSKYRPLEGVAPAKSVPSDGDWHYMFSTQFESCDARRAFPCFDEPNLKATFDLVIEIPDDQVAISNMPVKDTQPSKSGYQTVSFERTPVMSTYLLAWAVGDFEYIEAFTERRYNGKQLPVRLYTTRGLKEQGHWALQHAPKIIDYFSDIFGIDYPLPKSDILAVHEFTHGAMENWGLVTYRMTAILFDEKKSEARFRNRIAYVVAHELAHQWFGNLVTMDWWDELWLNEGFATWAGWFATAHLHPDWEVWAQFVNEGMETALQLDGIRASHPIQVPVRDALDVNQIFDSISYLKGCSVIRMLANHLGVETFLKGVGAYLKKHQYGNAKTKALWDALSEASGQDVNHLMSSWIEKIGFPVLTVAEEPGQISIKQSRFLSTGDVKSGDDETTWWVPLALQGKAGVQGTQTLALTAKEETIRDIDDDFYKINTDAVGFYRVNYPPPRLAKFATQLSRLSIQDKIAIAGSAADLAFAGYGTTPALLSFLQGFSSETHFRVLNQALDSLGSIKGIFGDDKVIKAGLEKFTLQLIENSLRRLGWDFPEGEDYNTGLLRKRVILSAGINGHAVTQEEALKRFKAYVADQEKNPLEPNLRIPIYRVALQKDTQAAHDFIKKEWSTATNVDGKEVALLALGHVSDERLIKESLLPFLFNTTPPAPADDAIPAFDMHALAGPMSASRVGRPLLWAYMRDNWGRVEAKLGSSPIMLDRFVKISLNKFADEAAVAEIDAFFADKDTRGFNRTLETVKDRIRGRAAYRARDAAVLREWLVQNGYATAEKGKEEVAEEEES